MTLDDLRWRHARPRKCVNRPGSVEASLLESSLVFRGSSVSTARFLELAIGRSPELEAATDSGGPVLNWR